MMSKYQEDFEVLTATDMFLIVQPKFIYGSPGESNRQSLSKFLVFEVTAVSHGKHICSP